MSNLPQVAIDHGPAVFEGMAAALRTTFGALADMYNGKDGAWVDELMQSVRAEAALCARGRDVSADVEELISDCRRGLVPSAHIYRVVQLRSPRDL